MADAQQVDFLIAGLIGNSNSTNYNGIPLAGGKVYYYDVGTTDLKTIYTIADKSVASVNPVILSSEGTAEIFVDGSCDVRIDDADDVTIDTIDGLNYSVTTTSQTVVSVSANYTAIATNVVILVDSTGDNYTVTLMTAVGIAGEQIVIKKTVAANTVTIDGLSAETIDGLTTRVLYRQHEFIRIMSDGTNWRIIAASLEAWETDDSQRILLGHKTSFLSGASSTAAGFQHSGASLDSAAQTQIGFFNTANGPLSIIAKSRAASATAFADTPVTVITGDTIAKHQYTADDGTDLINIVAQVEVKVEGTIAGNRTPGAYIISTAADAQPSGLTEAARFDSSQITTLVGIKNTTPFVDNGDISKKLSFVLSGLTTGNTRNLTIPDADGTILINSSVIALASGGEAAPDVDAGGLCLNQGATDGNILTFKSSDVAHGISGAETDTYAEFKKQAGASGGFQIETFSEAGTSFLLKTFQVAAATTNKSSGAGAAINFEAWKGTTTVALGADENIMVIRTGTSARFIFDADGDSHQDVGTLWTNFDDEDDALAVRGLMGTLEKDSAKKHLHDMVKYNAQKLHDMGVITFTPKDKSPSGQDEMFLSNKGILGLYGGAISELYGVADLMAKRLGTNYEAMKQEYRQNQLA